ncbi:unnamed protein product [Hymenolepis diminuta]|uniref:Peptidase A2 domain-containing protein n=1 Tax=Hymenolepis diminuta TaxID=6216 RepID=A0A564Z2E4_HYMDI|nr:unnamed protein product [Hymenolepis diminuta]
MNRGADFVVVCTSTNVALSLDISDKTTIRMDTEKGSVGAVNPSHRRGLYQAQHSQVHGIPTTMLVNISTRYCETLCLNGVFLELQVDTGSDIAIISNEAWKIFGSPKHDTVPFKVSSVSGEIVRLSGAMKWEKSPTEVFMDRNVRTVQEVKLPKRALPYRMSHNQKNDFAVDTPVYACNYRLGPQ